MTAQLEIPDYLSEEAADLITKLLERDPVKRLSDPKVIKSHPYFDGIAWTGLSEKKVVPPYKPPVKSNDSIENIDTSFTDMPVKDPEEKAAEVDAHFADFTYHGN
eukprot:TRINITY_DN1957_c0_g3_i2.p1 TRINITY_DN1957_c0_g3~~TRINITY_DN1957_c0_g3_i2.p1  ORF type:complete len:114 (+),score=36.35 TRINITY_DN1957_c0_g3_i2:28-342(+)